MGETIRYIKRYNNNTMFVVEVIPDNSNGLLNKIKKEMPRSKSSLTSLSYVNKIPQSNNNVNNDISSC